MAIDCPKVRLSLGDRRWIIEGKNPSMFEKLCRGRVGKILSCFEVKIAISKAMRRPRIETNNAASLRVGGIVITGVFKGGKLSVIISPAIMLPQARRLIGLITAGLFSLIGRKEVNRGVPIVTKKITRKLYTAVKEVAIKVRTRAQALRWEVFRASIIASLE